MKKPTRLSLALLISAGALSAALSAPAVFAEDGHGGHRDGRGSDDVAAVTTPAVGVDDNDINDDRGNDAAVTTVAAASDDAVADADAVADDND